MSRIARLALPVLIALALIAVAGLDIRLALATRDLTVETTAALDEHERRLNGRSAVTTILDEHERRAASPAGSPVTYAAPALDTHERRAVGQAAAGGTSSVPARLDEHERRAAAR